MLVDATIFFNELAMLQLRMRELYDLVDRFVVVEAGETFSGQPKPFYLQAQRGLLEDPQGKLIYIQLPRLPPLWDNSEASRFRLEAYQRDALLPVLLHGGLRPDDLVLLSDVDEVPSRSAVQQFRQHAAPGQVMQFSQLMLKRNLEDTTADGFNRRLWGGTLGVRFSYLGRASPNELRQHLAHSGELLDRDLARQRGITVLEAGGWHFSSFGGAALADYKLSHYAHGVARPPVADPHGRLVQLGRPMTLSLADEARLAATILHLEALLGVALPETLRRRPADYAAFFSPTPAPRLLAF
jgi:hypothetical protein